MDLAAWLRRWLTRHPLKEPPAPDRAQYTAEVMAQIKSLQPTPAPQQHWLPRLAPLLATAAAVAVVAVVIGNRQQPVPQIAKEPAPPPMLMFAEDSPEDEGWLEDTLELLDALDSELPEDLFDDWSDDDWLEELDMYEEDIFSS